MALLHGGDYDPDPGDSIRLHKKDDSGRSSHKVRLVKTDEKGNRWIDIPRGFTKGDAVYLLQTKSMSKRYKRILPQDLAQFRLHACARLGSYRLESPKSEWLYQLVLLFPSVRLFRYPYLEA